MGLDNMDFALYLNIAFYSMLGIGILVGFLKGFRRSLYTFIITIIFIGVFFLTVNSIVGYLYTMELGFLGGILGNVSPDLNNVTSLKDAISILLAQQVEGSLDTTLSNPEFLAFVDSIGMFVLKIVYTILYFTVIQFIYRFILFIISLFIFRKGRSKNKKGNKTRWAGSIFGFMTAAVNVFVFIIVMSGIMSIAESLVSLQTTELNNTVEITEPNRESISDINNASNSLMIGEYQQLAETTDSELTQAIESLEQIIADYNNNLIIKLSNSVKVEDEITSEEQSLGIILFDEVLSIKYNDTNIALREDLRTFSEVASIYLNSDYYDSGDLADLSSTEINNIFTTLSQSNLLVSIIPIGVEVGADYFDVDVELDKETLYEDIIWRDEIQQIGAVASTGFMILESANAFDPDIDYKTVSLDGEDVEDLFDSLSESKLVEYGAYLAVEPLLEQASLEMQSVITIPEDIDWKDEFVAFGDIANEILSSGITIADLESGDVQQILTLFSDVDLTVLLNSKLTTRALVNILSGQSELELNIDFLVIPDMPYEDWVDQYDTLGELVSEGELRKILSSINILVDSVSDIDFDDLQINDLTNISSDDIDNIFESRVLVASVTEAIRGLSTDELSLIIPDSVLDEDNYIEKQEVKNLFNAITMAAGQLPCDADDTECEELGFDIDKILSLSETNINTLFDSEILFSTASNMIMEYGEDQLVIPEDTKITISVEEADLIIVNKTEIKNAFLAISVLGLSDLNNINVDASLLTNLAEADVDDPVTPEDETTTLDTTKSTKLFASKILHATISKFLLDETGENATVIVPILASEDYEDTTTDLVLIEDTVGGVDYISEEELTQILEAVLILQLSDFTDLDIAPEDLVANSDELLDSAILHATITDQLIKQIDDGAVTVPDTDVEGNSIFTTTAENDEYIIKDELSAIFNALDLLDITDFNSISLDSISLDTIIANDDALLDSAILHATISSEILKQRDAETLSVPNRDLDENLIIKTVSGTDFIVKSEIKNTLGALELLEIDDFTNVNVDISILNKLSVDPVTDPTTLSIDNANDLLKSKIVHMTITDLIIDAATPATVGEDAPIVVPYKAETNYNFTSTDYSYSSDMVRDYTTDDDEYIVEAEIIYLLKIILKLEITDLDSFGTDDPNDPLLAKILPHKDILFDSAIIQATITDQMINLESEDLIIPDKDYNEVDVILTREYIKSATETITDTYVSRVELEAALDALDKLEITDFSNIELDDMTFILDKIQNDNLLDSSILHATISEKIVAESETGNLVVPSRGTDEVVIKKDVMTVTYISEIEIIATLDALDVLGITDFTALNIDPSIIQNLGEYDAVDDRNELVPERATTLFASKIVHATISKMITDAAIPDEITGDQQLLVPYRAEINYDYNGYTDDEVRYYTDDDDEYIVEAELSALFNVIIALEINDLDDFNDSDPSNPLLARILPHRDILFDSSIIQATITDQMINLESEDLIIPDKDYDEVDVIVPKTYVDDELNSYTDTYITKVELEAALDALDKLNITDLSNVNLDDMTLILDKIQNDNLLDSSILHATISEKIIAESETGDLVIPNRGTDEVAIKKDVMTVTYISEIEIIATLDALDVLGITDFTALNIDPSIIQNLGEYDAVDDRNELVPERATTLFASKIVHATISKMITDAAIPDEITGDQQLLVPYRAEINYDYNGYTDDEVRYYTDDDDEYIVEAELSALFNVIIALEINDLDDFNDSDPSNPLLARILPHRDILFDSSIIQATISDQMIELESDDLVIPNKDYFEVDVIITRTYIDDELNSYTDIYITKVELDETLFALEELNITDLNSVNIDDFALISQKIKDESLLDSAILHATVSKKILLEGDGGNLTIPTYDLDESLITKTVGVDNTDYIKASEIEATLDALNVLEINSFEDVAVDVSILQNLAVDPEAVDKVLSTDKTQTLLSSKIVHATISKMMFDANEVDTITGNRDLYVPYVASESYQNINLSYADSADVRVTILATDEYIVEAELTELFEAILVLNISTFNDVSSLTLALINDKKSDLLDSAILHATISNQIIDLESTTDIVIPEINEAEVSIIDEDNTDPLDIIKYLAKQEIEYLLSAIVLIDNDPTHTINDITGTVELALFLPSQTTEADSNQDILFASSIMKATVSKQVFALEDGVSGILVPDVNQYNISIIVPDSEGDNDSYLIKNELKALINATDLVTNMNQISDFDGSIDLSVFFKSTYPSSPSTADDNQATLLSSSIMQATISNKIKDLDNNQIYIPTVDVLDNDVEFDYTITGDYFIERQEIKDLINVLDIVGDFSSIEAFDGVVDISVFDEDENPGNQDILLASAIMHQTVSKKIIDNASLDVPEQGFKHDDNSVYTVLITKVENDYDFIDGDDIRYLIDVMNLISTGGDMGSFSATVDMGLFADPTNQDTLLKSAVMHYTVSNQIKDNNQLVIPEISLEADNVTNETVIDLAGSYQFIIRDELKELIDVMNLVSSGSIDGFSSSFSLSTFASGVRNDPGQAETNQEMLLKSAIMHATISDQVIGMDDGTPTSTLIAPDYNFSDSQIKLLVTGPNLSINTTYYTQTEIANLIDGLNSLGLGSQSITSFDGGLSITTLSDPGVQQDLYDSSILHATISNQIINNNSLVVPDYSLEQDLSNVQIIFTTTNSEDYIATAEITDLINVMNLISSGSIDGFSSSFSLSTFASGVKNDPGQAETNQEMLLKSAIMHATISDQVIGMDDGTPTSTLIAPDYNFNNNQIKYIVTGTTYYTQTEIANLIDGLNSLGLGSQSITSFDGGLSITTLSDPGVQQDLYDSSILHATISNQIINNNSLVVPDYSLEQDLSNVQIVFTTTNSEDYIATAEITALIDVMNLVSTGGDVNAFSGNVDLSVFDEDTNPGNQDILLTSAIMHRTVSQQILDLPDEVLLVPTYTEDGAIEANRIYHEITLTANTSEYIVKDEVKAIITGFNKLGASDLGSYNASSSINAGDFFSDISTFLESSSFQATISKKIIDGNSGNLIIPNRDETNTYDIIITVYSEITSANMTYIEKQEIEYLVNGLNELSISDFSSSVSPTTITTLTGTQLDTILLSGTLHLTIEDIIQSNDNINTDIPDKALDDLYNLTDILIKSEVKAFILASKAFAGSGADLSNITFDFTTIAGKDETTRNIIIASMIVRNIITPEIESADSIDPFFTLQASDYEDGDVTSFLTADGIRRYIDYLNS